MSSLAGSRGSSWLCTRLANVSTPMKPVFSGSSCWIWHGYGQGASPGQLEAPKSVPPRRAAAGAAAASPRSHHSPTQSLPAASSLPAGKPRSQTHARRWHHPPPPPPPAAPPSSTAPVLGHLHPPQGSPNRWAPCDHRVPRDHRVPHATTGRPVPPSHSWSSGGQGGGRCHSLMAGAHLGTCSGATNTISRPFPRVIFLLSSPGRKLVGNVPTGRAGHRARRHGWHPPRALSPGKTQNPFPRRVRLPRSPSTSRG